MPFYCISEVNGVYISQTKGAQDIGLILDESWLRW